MLEKIFIKDYKNTEDAKVRNAYANTAGYFGIFTNLLLGVGKLIVGLLSKSVAVMADAVNNISDMATSALTILGFKLASKKPDRQHPYGHARYEYITSFVVSLFMTYMGVKFAIESIQKIFNPSEIDISLITYIILGASIVVKFLQMLVYRHFGKTIDSQALETTALDSRNDIISSSAILVAMAVMGIFDLNIDGYIGCAISVLIIISGLSSAKEGLEPIIGIVPTPEQVKMIADKIQSYDVCLGIHDMVIHNYGVHNDFVTVHVEVDSSRPSLEIHDKIDNIEADFRKDLGIQLTIHMDPIVVGDEKLDKYKTQVIEAFGKLDPDLSMHDFRMVEGDTHTNIIFDCVVPPEKNYTAEILKDYLYANVKNDEQVFYVIEIDMPYTM